MYSLDISVDVTWNLIMEHLNDTVEERRKERQPTRHKKITTCSPLKTPEWYQTPTFEEKQALREDIKISREKIKAKNLA